MGGRGLRVGGRHGGGVATHYARTLFWQHRDRLIDLGPNLTGTQIGLVVPDITVGRQTAGSGQRPPYITAESIEDLKSYADKFHGKIIGIDPESGIMKKTRETMREYGIVNYQLVRDSEVP